MGEESASQREFDILESKNRILALKEKLTELNKHTVTDLPEMIHHREKWINDTATWADKLSTSDSKYDTLKRDRIIEKIGADALTSISELLKGQLLEDFNTIYEIHTEVKAEATNERQETEQELTRLRAQRKDELKKDTTAYTEARKKNSKHYKKQREYEYSKLAQARKRRKAVRRGYEPAGNGEPVSENQSSFEERLAERRPTNAFTGFFSGRSQWATNEMGRLGFCEEKCKKCKDSGYEECHVDKDCTRSKCYHWKYFGATNLCVKPCTACDGRNTTKIVYLKERVYDSKAPNGCYYKEGTECTLKTMTKSWFNLRPQATVKITSNGRSRTVTVPSTKLMRHKNVPREVGLYKTSLFRA